MHALKEFQDTDLWHISPWSGPLVQGLLHEEKCGVCSCKSLSLHMSIDLTRGPMLHQPSLGCEGTKTVWVAPEVRRHQEWTAYSSHCGNGESWLESRRGCVGVSAWYWRPNVSMSKTMRRRCSMQGPSPCCDMKEILSTHWNQKGSHSPHACHRYNLKDGRANSCGVVQGLRAGNVTLDLGRNEHRLDWTEFILKGRSLGVLTSRRTSGVQGFLGAPTQ